MVTGQNAISVEENRDPTIAVASYSAVDPEGEAITRWSLGGSDANDFTINDNGELAFRSTPDYDRPADSDHDNQYHLTVRAYDGRTYGNLDVTIAVRNQNEHAPVIRERQPHLLHLPRGSDVGPVHLQRHRRRQGRRDCLEYRRARREPL